VIRFLRDLFLKDAMLKLFSLILAILTWLALSYVHPQSSLASTVSLYSRHVTFSNVEVVVLSSASDVHDFRVEPKTVEVTVEVDVKALQGLQSKDVRALVDLTDLQPGADVRKQIEVSTPVGVRYVKVTPREVRVLSPAQH
jgi:YbbR domain-containing protein